MGFSRMGQRRGQESSSDRKSLTAYKYLHQKKILQADRENYSVCTQTSIGAWVAGIKPSSPSLPKVIPLKASKQLLGSDRNEISQSHCAFPDAVFSPSVCQCRRQYALSLNHKINITSCRIVLRLDRCLEVVGSHARPQVPLRQEVRFCRTFRQPSSNRVLGSQRNQLYANKPS